MRQPAPVLMENGRTMRAARNTASILSAATGLVILAFIVILSGVTASGGADRGPAAASAVSLPSPSETSVVVSPSAPPSTKKTLAPAPTPTKVDDRPNRTAGIIDMHYGFFPSSEFLVGNVYNHPIDNSTLWILVYVGRKAAVDADASNVANGPAAVWVFTETPSSTMNEVGLFADADATGEFHVTRVDGPRMMLVDGQRHSFTFDLDTDKF